MKSYVAHYRNKYPGGRVDFSENHLDAYDKDGTLRVALRIGGGGVLLDKGDELGASDKHDLAPIPKNARVHKLTKDGKITLDEKAAERKQAVEKLVSGGKIHSIAEYKEAGAEVDAEGNVVL